MRGEKCGGCVADSGNACTCGDFVPCTEIMWGNCECMHVVMCCI